MTLVFHELIDTLSQLIHTEDRPAQIYAICPHLYFANYPTGTLQMRVFTDTDDLVAISENVSLASIPINEPYFHGQVRFLIKTTLREDRNYRIELRPISGYSFTPDSFIAWCNDYDLRKVDAEYQPNGGFHAPLDMEIWETRQASREIE